jgi:hypothetical protein
MSIQNITRPFSASSGETIETLFSTLHATMHAPQPVHLSRSITIAHFGMTVRLS